MITLRRWSWLPLLLLSMAFVLWGLREGQWHTVLGWAREICTSCIGLTF